MTSVSDYIRFLLGTADPLVGLPLAAAGVAMVLLGWRMWRFCLAVTLALVGFLVVMLYIGAPEQPLLYGVAGGLALAVIGGFYANQAIGALGGIVGAGLTHNMLAGAGLIDAVVWVATALSFVVFSAVSFFNRRKVAIVITSFQGAVLLMAGLTVLVKSQPELYEFFRGAAVGHRMIFLPLVLLVPTVIGCLLQGADIRRLNADN